jgi:hypothetical protein
VGQASIRGGPPGVELQDSRGAGEGVGFALGDVGLRAGDIAGEGKGETSDVGVGELSDDGAGETGNADEGIAIPVDLGPQPAAIIVATTSPTTALLFKLDHSSKSKRRNDEKVFGAWWR